MEEEIAEELIEEVTSIAAVETAVRAGTTPPPQAVRREAPEQAPELARRIVRPTRIPRKRTAAQAGWARPPRAHPAAGAGAGARPGAPANRPANPNPQVANRGPREMGAPAAAARPEVGARPARQPMAAAPPVARNNPRPQAQQPSPYRGFAKAPTTGLNKTAFARIAPGGEAIAASARGRASLGHAPAPPRAAPPAHAAARPAPRHILPHQRHTLPHRRPASIEQSRPRRQGLKDRPRKAPLRRPGPYQLRKEQCFKRAIISEKAPAAG